MPTHAHYKGEFGSGAPRTPKQTAKIVKIRAKVEKLKAMAAKKSATLEKRYARTKATHVKTTAKIEKIGKAHAKYQAQYSKKKSLQEAKHAKFSKAGKAELLAKLQVRIAKREQIKAKKDAAFAKKHKALQAKSDKLHAKRSQIRKKLDEHTAKTGEKVGKLQGKAKIGTPIPKPTSTPASREKLKSQLAQEQSAHAKKLISEAQKPSKEIGGDKEYTLKSDVAYHKERSEYHSNKATDYEKLHHKSKIEDSHTSSHYQDKAQEHHAKADEHHKKMLEAQKKLTEHQTAVVAAKLSDPKVHAQWKKDQDADAAKAAEQNAAKSSGSQKGVYNSFHAEQIAYHKSQMEKLKNEAGGDAAKKYANHKQMLEHHEKEKAKSDKMPGIQSQLDHSKKEVDYGEHEAMREHMKSALPKQERAACEAYSNGSYSAWNSALRKDNYDKLSADSKKSIEHLDNALKRPEAAAQKDMIVYRGVGNKSFSIEVGGVYQDKGFISTSIKKGTAEGFGSGTVFHISIPKGHPAAAIPSLHSQEREILLPRGTKFKVTKIEPSNGYGPRIVHMTPHTE